MIPILRTQLPSRSAFNACWLLAAALSLPLMGGCRVGLTDTLLTAVTGTQLELVSTDSGSTFSPALPHCVYRYRDADNADIFLSDIPFDRLGGDGESADGSGLSGTVVHIHIFLTPEAGQTPIESTAFNATVRQFILIDGVAGLYAGGGFVTSGSFGGGSVAGRVRDVSLRLVRAGGPFTDPLGTASLTGTFRATLDEPAAAAAHAWTRSIALRAGPR